MSGLTVALLVLALIGPCYAAVMMVGPGRRQLRRPERRRSFHLICVVPCLNEAVVIGETIGRLVSLEPGVRVVAVNDASDDGTSIVLDRLEGHRVLALHRSLPDARQGKGAALNRAFTEISAAARAQGVDPSCVIIGVFDGDGRVDEDVLDAVLPWFEDDDVGGVQIGVRIDNRGSSLLARMQDVEFVSFTRIFQRARNLLTTSGLGGNGQFTRLSALERLGPRPWRDALTEDLDLGVRLRLEGLRTVFDGSVSVHQQGLHSVRALVRQRTRWFQGHLQAYGLLPSIWRSRLLRPIAKLDLSAHLLLPVMLLFVAVGVLASAIAILWSVVTEPHDLLALWSTGVRLPIWYLTGFAAVPLIAVAYWRSTRVGLFKALILAHLYSVFTWVWFAAGWRAIARMARGRTGWTKTERVAESVIPFTIASGGGHAVEEVEVVADRLRAVN